MSTDTAFALGMLALVGRRAPDRMRTFLLTFAVVDDLAALAIIAVFYSRHISLPALLAGLAIFAVVFAVRAAGVRRGAVYLALGVVAWAAFLRSGVDPVVVGLVMGLFTQAYPAARGDLELATEPFRLFREQPTPELARVAGSSLSAAISPNERLQQTFHPWTSYVIVPLFALANAGDPDQRPLSRPRVHLAGHPRHPGRVRGRQAGWASPAPPVAGHLAQPRRDPPAGRLGLGDRGGHHRRHRVHRLAAHRLARLPRRRSWPRPRSGCWPRRCARRSSPRPCSG